MMDSKGEAMMEPELVAEIKEKIFTYHPPKGDQAERYVKIRDMAKDMALAMVEMCPPGREFSLARTKLEESVMWANAAIARNE